jgi:hypothetical protein
MNNLHYYYDQLKADEMEFVDRVIESAYTLRKERFNDEIPSLLNDDSVEMADDAIAKWVIASRKKNA